MSRVSAFFYSRHLPSPPFALLTETANLSQECLHPRCAVKFRDVKDGDVACLGDWVGAKGGGLNLIGEPNFRTRRLEWKDVQGAICKHDGSEALEEKERALENDWPRHRPRLHEASQSAALLCVHEPPPASAVSCGRKG
jgi:hypothetical protein